MGKTFRIPTKVGVDQSITLQVDQDFEQLEILSLKIRQEDVYTRNCSDYGVLTGRVFVNNGYGLPNAKVSIFIPITEEDTGNPVIESIYPYKTLTQVNSDGYRYNLLPYIPSYSGHTPTGTFPTRLDSLVDNTVVELYDKYYKFTVTTNDSGDYMIFGVPVGTQTMVMNVDLSDIGEFSLTPDDLIRMGVGVEGQFDGNRFKSSPNFSELPQIITINKTVNISPFWGQPDVCQISITRTDFDLSSEANIIISPTSIFMGSILSTSENDVLKTSCVPDTSLGELCSLVTGPGEILALRQTILLDNKGQPVLEVADLPNGGRVIDENGTWLLDLPMNLDYIYTNEFGQRVISNDPTVGVPTKGKYRFKIKWQQSDTLSESVRRGYFLVPNIREYGWDANNPNQDPLIDPLAPPQNRELALKSYSFSLDWSAYTDYNVAVNCEDYFYEFDYNKVYTVAQIIDNVKTDEHREKFLGIKTIDDRTCEENVNKFPVNDGVFHATTNWRIMNFLLIILNFFLPILIIILHILIGLFELVIVLMGVLGVIFGFIAAAKFIQAGQTFPALILALGLIFEGVGLVFQSLFFVVGAIALAIAGKPKHPISLPMLTFPSCESCECEDIPNPDPNSSTVQTPPGSNVGGNTLLVNFNGGQTSSEYYDQDVFEDYFPQPCFDFTDPNTGFGDVQGLLGGEPFNDVNPTSSLMVPTNTSSLYTDTLPLGERINLFNTKGKYFTSENRIRVTWDSINPSNSLTTQGTHHNDNTITILVNSQAFTQQSGDMITFVNPSFSQDPNITGGSLNNLGTFAVTGTTTYYTGINSSIVVNYANPSNPIQSQSITYTTLSQPQSAGDELVYSYPADIEYLQVVTAMTLGDFFSISNSTPAPGTFAGILSGYTDIRCAPSTDVQIQPISGNSNYLSDYKVVVLQRGVDPYSPKYKISYDLSRIFGYSTLNPNCLIIDNVGRYRLNIPIQPGGPNGLCSNHHLITNNSVNNNGFLFFPSYHFTPSPTDFTGSSFTTKLHQYYSSLDSLHNNFSIDPNNLSSTQLSSYSSTVNNSKRTITNNIFNGGINPPPNSNQHYSPTSTNLDGGSYMFDSSSSPGSNRLYFSPTYMVTNPLDTVTMSTNTRIVMRSDRLPTSSSTADTLNNRFLLQQNPVFVIFDETGQSTAPSTNISAPPIGGAGGFSVSGNQMFTNVLNTFDCEGMVQLSCYSANGTNFVVKPDCGTDDAVSGGCYVFVKKPLEDLGKDIDNAVEWGYRLRFFYALCSGVLSHVFNNNWINGTLFAYSYRMDTEFDLNNQPFKVYCDQTLVLDQTNNVYYRSSPYVSGLTQPFIGRPADQTENKTNLRNLMYPTTIVNFGPKNHFLEEIILNGNYDGFNMNKLPFTSYGPTGDLVNFFSVVRISGNVNWSSGLSDNLISNLFSRPQERVDADFAQLSSINSELGIIKFDANYYTTTPPNAPALTLQGMSQTNNSFDNMMGVFFEQDVPEDIQTRDYVSPVRTILQNTQTGSFTYSPINVKSQIVPFYRWDVKQTTPTNVFGTALNNWATGNGLGNLPNDIIIKRYQQLDRLSDPYFQSPVIPNDYLHRGYIYSLDNLGNYSANGVTSTTNPILVGAPNHHYYGLRKGSTAMNRFYTKYIGENI